MPIDIEGLINQSVSGPMSTQRLQVEPGEYQFVVDLGDVREWVREVNTKNGVRYILEVPCVCQDPDVKAKLNRDKVVVRSKGLWLDLTESGALSTAEGENVDLGQLRKALGKNEGDFSLGALPGAGPFMGRVAHEKSQQESDDRTFARVVNFAPIVS